MTDKIATVQYATRTDAKLILSKLALIDEHIQQVLAGIRMTHTPHGVEHERLMSSLDKLTIKRHAVLTAVLGDRDYQQIAEDMQVDVTTVKLHLRAALQILDIPGRQMLLIQNKDMLKPITDKEYEMRYGISKTWWLEKKKKLMDVLLQTKPSHNQYTKGAV